MNDNPDNSLPRMVAPSPPPELAPHGAAFSTENFAASQVNDCSPVVGWQKIIDRIGLGAAVEEVGHADSPPHALAIVLPRPVLTGH